MSKLTENDFFVAIQSVLLNAKENGWTYEKIEECAMNAADEFFESEFPDEYSGDDFDEE